MIQLPTEDLPAPPPPALSRHPAPFRHRSAFFCPNSHLRPTQHILSLCRIGEGSSVPSQLPRSSSFGNYFHRLSSFGRAENCLRWFWSCLSHQTAATKTSFNCYSQSLRRYCDLFWSMLGYLIVFGASYYPKHLPCRHDDSHSCYFPGTETVSPS